MRRKRPRTFDLTKWGCCTDLGFPGVMGARNTDYKSVSCNTMYRCVLPIGIVPCSPKYAPWLPKGLRVH